MGDCTRVVQAIQRGKQGRAQVAELKSAQQLEKELARAEKKFVRMDEGVSLLYRYISVEILQGSHYRWSGVRYAMHTMGQRQTYDASQNLYTRSTW